MPHFFIKGPRQIFGIRPLRRVPQDFPPLLYGIHIGIADKTLFDGLCAAQDKSLSLGMSRDL